jgi:hypothetical protein
MMGRLLGCVMAMQRKHKGWGEAMRATQWEMRWRKSDRGEGDVIDRGERSGGKVLVGKLWGGHLSAWDRVRGSKKWFETSRFFI